MKKFFNIFLFIFVFGVVGGLEGFSLFDKLRNILSLGSNLGNLEQRVEETEQKLEKLKRKRDLGEDLMFCIEASWIRFV